MNDGRIKWVYIFVLAIAILAPVLAFLDRRKSKDAADWKYILGNLAFNLIGAGAALKMLSLMKKEISDFRYLNEFYVVEIIGLAIPVCLSIALSYQALEQEKSQKEKMGHSPSLEWKNQICNVIHLFNAYFCAMVSVIFVVSYTIYCHIHHVELYLDVQYLYFLSIALFFFYVCGVHESEHVHMVFVVFTPVIMISSIYWMSWFTVDRSLIRWQMVFIMIHSLVYALIFYFKKGIVVFGKAEKTKDSAYKIHFNRIISIKIKHLFYIIMLVAIIAVYYVLWWVPFRIERISYIRAARYINEICMDTDKDADELVNEMRNREWWDDENEDVDQVRYLEFLYDNLREELIGKGVISKEEKSLSYKNLTDWSDELPWQYFQH